MDRQAFSRRNLERTLRKGDFHNVKSDVRAEYRELLIKQSLIAAKNNFGEPSNPLVKFNLKRRTVFKIDEHSHRIIERKISWNLRRITQLRTANRTFIVENLKSLLREGIAFRVYRLDIQSFYESFDRNEILRTINDIPRLSPHTKRLLNTLLLRHAEHAGTGIPRGIGLSSILSEFLMAPFDRQLQSKPGVFFYARYVDDIVVITSGDEQKEEFLTYIKGILPTGLRLNPTKLSASEKIRYLREKPHTPETVVSDFEYLGYRFIVRNPKNLDEPRQVAVDISKGKIQRYKTRLSRAFYCFAKDGDWDLLIDRVKYLANNFSVYNPRIGRRKLAGIYHSYPIADSDCSGLRSLDQFLRNLTLNKKNRIGMRVHRSLDNTKKRVLLSNLFTSGHSQKSFVHFSMTRIGEIKDCWKN